MSVRDYIVRRRMTKCARALCEEPERSILDIALQYGYGSNEAFTRAFHQVWNCSPSQFRKSQQPVELFPRLMCPLETGDDYMKERKHMDITELYDLFTAHHALHVKSSRINELQGSLLGTGIDVGCLQRKLLPENFKGLHADCRIRLRETEKHHGSFLSGDPDSLLDRKSVV